MLLALHELPACRWASGLLTSDRCVRTFRLSCLSSYIAAKSDAEKHDTDDTLKLLNVLIITRDDTTFAAGKRNCLTKRRLSSQPPTVAAGGAAAPTGTSGHGGGPDHVRVRYCPAAAAPRVLARPVNGSDQSSPSAPPLQHCALLAAYAWRSNILQAMSTLQ